MPKLSYPDTQSLLAGFLSISFVGVIILLIFHPLPAESASSSMINTLTGVLGTMTVSVTTYYFGSSKGSASKDETINSIVTKSGETQ